MQDNNGQKEKKGFFQRLKDGLKKTQANVVGRLDRLVFGKKLIDADLLEELEEILVTSDFGIKTVNKLVASVQDKVSRKVLNNADELKKALHDDIYEILKTDEKPLKIEKKPFLIMVIGINGVGKTTTIGKLASQFRAQGKSVLLAAGDTFRAAAIEQLDIWAERSGAGIIKQAFGSDPSAVIFDAIASAKRRDVDIILADTAGRLHTKVNLMEELKKIYRIANRELEAEQIETLLVIDSTTGQNAVSQVKTFNKEVGVSGLVVTKLDGTAKGGVIVGIADEFKIPVRYIGIGEQIDDLREFRAKEFVDALF
ncbi:signal recognition particle-docking protein FtsY [Thermodesulfobacteriota bacterium]